MLTKRLIYVVAVMLLVISCSESIQEDQGKIVFVQNKRLIAEFDMRLELLREVENKTAAEQELADSLNVMIEKLEIQLTNDNRLSSEQKNLVYEKEFRRYLKDKEAIDNRVANLEKEALELVIKRLNGYIEEYAKEKGYLMVLGANGEGTILYGEKSSDVTDELITYCNEKYSGK